MCCSFDQQSYRWTQVSSKPGEFHWDQAVALDEAGDLVGEVREAIRTMLDTLGEPMVPALRN